MKRLLSTKLGMLLSLAGALMLFSGFSAGGCGGPGKVPSQVDPCNSDDDCSPSYYCDVTNGSTEPGLPVPLPAPAPETDGGSDDGTDDETDEIKVGTVSQPCMAEEGHQPPTTKRRKKRRYRGTCRPRKRQKPRCYSNSDCKANEYCKIGPQPMIGCVGSSSKDGDPEAVGCGMPRPSGVCAPRKAKPGRCKTSTDCRRGQICKRVTTVVSCGGAAPRGEGDEELPVRCMKPTKRTYGICIDAPKPPKKTCRSNSDCSRNETCSKAQPGTTTTRTNCATEDNDGNTSTNCARPMPMPPAVGVCIPKTKKNTCYSNRDCRSGYVCNIKDSKPAPPMPCGATTGSKGDDDGEGDDEDRPACNQSRPSQPPPAGVCEPARKPEPEPAPAPQPAPEPAPAP